MISTLMDMFYRTHVKGTEEYEKDFKKLIDVFLSDIASGMYVYMLMLDNTNRKQEFNIVKGYRDNLFNLREICKNTIPDDICYSLKIILDQINIHTTLLRTNPETAWESTAFISLSNDIARLKFKIEDFMAK